MDSQYKPLNLTLWNEIVGSFEGLSCDRICIYVKIHDTTLSFPKGSLESKILHEELCAEKIGRKIGILRCDEPMKPILVRRIVR